MSGFFDGVRWFSARLVLRTSDQLTIAREKTESFLAKRATCLDIGIENSAGRHDHRSAHADRVATHSNSEP